jgi:hypothetical protein
MGRTGQQALALGAAAVIVAAAGAAVVVLRGPSPVANAATVLSHVRDAQLVTARGVATPAHSGQRVPDGDVVRTGRAGAAQLSTRGRVVYVGPSAAVAVLDGAHQQLRTGNAVIDAQQGPGVTVSLAGDELSVPDGSVTEATRSVAVSVGSLAGPSRISSAAGRRLSVPALNQTVFSGDALPAATTPLQLSDDAAESQAVPGLVSDDLQLKTLARGINSSGTATARVVEAAWSGTTSPAAAAMPRSDGVLPIVIADATRAAGGTAQQRYDHVVSWRRQGGSWGVVVELLSAHAGAVESTLVSLQRRQPAGQLGNVDVQALAVANPAGTASTQTHGGSTSPPGTSPPGSPSGGRHGKGGSGPTPSPSPTQGAVTKVVGTVKGVVSTVVGLVPTPKPSSSGLLGGLLGH